MADGAAPRLQAARAVAGVLAGRSLSERLPALFEGLPPRDRALAQELAYGAVRYQPRLAALLPKLLQRPLKEKDRDVEALLLVGLYQLAMTDVPPHAAVAETVGAVRRLRKPWASGLVNAVLRRFQREGATLLAAAASSPVPGTAHPEWLLARFRTDWGERWEALALAGNERPPMTLRVNRREQDRDTFLAELERSGIAAAPAPFAPDGITLETPLPVERLPGFSEGRVSVQDAAAQLAPDLLRPEPGERLLDACAAPGGKTGHLLERCPGAQVVALDRDPDRLRRVEENLARLKLQAELVAADAGSPGTWWDGRPFDRILLDAPCSGTGVIRRHPDIKLLRRDSDIPVLAAEQRRLLEALWSLLAPGGMLVYATCSVLRDENDRQLAAFLAGRSDAAELPIDAPWGEAMPVGRQILTGEDGMDGFYYARLVKR